MNVFDLKARKLAVILGKDLKKIEESENMNEFIEKVDIYKKNLLKKFIVKKYLVYSCIAVVKAILSADLIIHFNIF